MFAGLLVIEIFATPFSKVFGLSGNTQFLCISAMRIISISFVFAGTNIALQGVFQALDSGIESLIISVCRQLLFIIPMAYVFSKIAIASPDKSYIVWLSFPITEFLSSVIAVVLMKNIYKKKIKILN